MTWIRLSVAVIGSTTVLRTSGPGRPPFGVGPNPVQPVGRTSGAGSTGARSGTTVTTVLLGTTSAGAISATSCIASCLEQPKNRGSTAARFSSVIT